MSHRIVRERFAGGWSVYLHSYGCGILREYAPKPSVLFEGGHLWYLDRRFSRVSSTWLFRHPGPTPFIRAITKNIHGASIGGVHAVPRLLSISLGPMDAQEEEAYGAGS